MSVKKIILIRKIALLSLEINVTEKLNNNKKFLLSARARVCENIN